MSSGRTHVILPGQATDPGSAALFVPEESAPVPLCLLIQCWCIFYTLLNHRSANDQGSAAKGQCRGMRAHAAGTARIQRAACTGCKAASGRTSASQRRRQGQRPGRSRDAREATPAEQVRRRRRSAGGADVRYGRTSGPPGPQGANSPRPEGRRGMPGQTARIQAPPDAWPGQPATQPTRSGRPGEPGDAANAGGALARLDRRGVASGPPRAEPGSHGGAEEGSRHAVGAPERAGKWPRGQTGKLQLTGTAATGMPAAGTTGSARPGRDSRKKEGRHREEAQAEAAHRPKRPGQVPAGGEPLQ